MSTNKKVYLIVFAMLGILSIATIFNVAINFREFSKKTAIEKAHLVAESVRDGLTAHMVNGTMSNRGLFLENMIKHQDVTNLHLLRSKSVTELYGNGIDEEHIISRLEKRVLDSGKSESTLIETTNSALISIAIPYIATKYSNPNCLSCHTNAQEGDVLGVISMDVDVQPVRHEGIMIISKIVVITFIFLIIAILIAKHFIKPYIRLFDDLEEGISKAYRGDFSYKVETTLADEAGRVAQRLNELSEIFRFKKTIELDKDKKTIYNRIRHILEIHFKIDDFTMFEVDSELKTKSVVIITKSKAELPDTIFSKDSQVCRAFRTNDTVVSTDFYKICESCHQDGVETLCLPFNISDKYSLILHIRTRSKKEMVRIRELLPVITNYLELAEPVLETKFLMEVLEMTTLKDGPTGLFNRRFLDQFMDSLNINDGRSFATLMVDIDFFKQVNDTYGHDIGDSVIVGLSKILQDNVKGSDLAIRYGGEEFLVMIFNVDETIALKIANSIRVQFSKKLFKTSSDTISKTLSIGISLFPTHTQNPWQAVKFADVALYEAKNSGRDKIVLFDESMYEDEEY
ncbi:MAG: GGDEF domain-containing protein [Campylobacterota bacterium]|nr:GGDEF domain-containing protein [Campylobacterota bacterium]